VACSSPSKEETPKAAAVGSLVGVGATATARPGDPTATAVGNHGESISYPPPSLPYRALTFRVTVPADTPANDYVYVMFHGADSMFTTDHVHLERESATVCSGDVQVPEGGMIRYANDGWDGGGCCDSRLITREALFAGQADG
jgi:hypothetical protein